MDCKNKLLVSSDAFYLTHILSVKTTKYELFQGNFSKTSFFFSNTMCCKVGNIFVANISSHGFKIQLNSACVNLIPLLAEMLSQEDNISGARNI